MSSSLCAVLIGATAIAGCGGDDGDSTAAEGPQFSAAAEPANVFIKRTAKLLATTDAKRDCPQLDQISQRSYVRFSCPPDKRLRESMDSFKIVGWKEYGTGAVVDYRSGKIKDGAAIVLFAGSDRNWGIARFGVVSKPSTKTTDEDSREDFENAVDDYMTAVRDRDCEAFQKVKFITPETKEKDICGEIFGATKELATRIKAHPEVEPTYEGGNATYGFFTYETVKPEEGSTISVIDAGNQTLVLDVSPSQTARQRKAVLEQYRQQQKKGGPDQPEKSPSKKAD